jgi:hypothetical protein
MGLTKHSGSLTSDRSTAQLSQHENLPGKPVHRFITPSSPLVIGDKEYTQQIEIKNTFTNRTAIDPKRFTDIHKLTLAFPSAFTIKVTYFNRYNKHNTATYASHSPQGVHPIHNEYTQIDQFELKVINGFEFSYDQENNKSDFTGEAVIYPGFIPKIDDFFIMDLKDGHLGLCRISNVVRLSMRQASYHKVDAYLFAYMNDDLWTDIQKSVTNKVIFNREAYFNDTISLLQYDSYTALQKSYELKQDIIDTYFKEYYNPELESITTSTDLYDPYIIQFLHNHVSIQESKKRPFQHVNPLLNYERSFWSVLENKRYKNIIDCFNKYNIVMHDPSSYHVNMNALYKKYYIELSTTGKYDYIFHEGFYKDILSSNSQYDIEHILLDFLINQNLNINQCLNLFSDFKNINNQLKFYFLPIYIYLLNEIINQLLHGKQP